MGEQAHKLYIVESDMPIPSEPPLITIMPTLPWHLRELAANLRVEDENEIVAFGFTPSQALWRSYKASLFRKTALIDGKVAAAWGICGKFMGETGAPWLLTTSEVKKVSPLKFTRIYQQEVKEMLKLFPKLENYTIASYTAAIRLLDIVGFKLDEPEPMGGNNALYRKFSKVAI